VTIGTAVANLTRAKCRVQVVRSLTPGITLAFSVWLLKKSATKEAIGYAGHPRAFSFCFVCSSPRPNVGACARRSLAVIAGGVILTTLTELDFHVVLALYQRIDGPIVQLIFMSCTGWLHHPYYRMRTGFA
jgi:hypothetical protein